MALASTTTQEHCSSSQKIGIAANRSNRRYSSIATNQSFLMAGFKNRRYENHCGRGSCYVSPLQIIYKKSTWLVHARIQIHAAVDRRRGGGGRIIDEELPRGGQRVGEGENGSAPPPFPADCGEEGENGAAPPHLHQICHMVRGPAGSARATHCLCRIRLCCPPRAGE